MGKISKQVQGPRSQFIKVKCPDCESEQVTFSKVAMKVNCQVCGANLVEPRGGEAKFRAQVTKILE